MASVSLTGSDVHIIQGRLLTDLADGDCGALTFPNDIAAAKVGKNGNAIYSFNQTGKLTQYVVRVLRGSSDDKFLNNLYTQMVNNFAGFILMNGEFIKKVGDGKGNITSDTYIMSGGIFTKGVEAKDNQEGDTEQAVSIYTFNFTNSPRSIG